MRSDVILSDAGLMLRSHGTRVRNYLYTFLLPPPSPVPLHLSKSRAHGAVTIRILYGPFISPGDPGRYALVIIRIVRRIKLNQFPFGWSIV